jgi:predicted dithiol-disulfide oxidoreductase (DUF899 family)
MSERTTGTRAEWLAARAELLEREREHTRAGDQPMGWLRRHDEYPTEQSGR